jgi:sporulation and cell division protein SsgA
MNSLTSVTCEIHLRLLVDADSAETVPTTLAYRPSDPYAVYLTVHTTSGPVEWIFARELLHDGRHRPAGVGDLHVAPGTDENGLAHVSIELRTPDGDAILHADPEDISAFLADTFLAVPPGRESALLDIDAALAILFARD